MANFYATQFVGVADGTVSPAEKADGRQVGAKKSVTPASKLAGQAWALADKIYVGRLRAGELLTGFSVVSDTSFGTTTISLGTLADPTKYVNAKTMTVVDIPTMLGPKASVADDGPVSAGEDLWVTLGVGGVAGAVLATFLTETAGAR